MRGFWGLPHDPLFILSRTPALGVMRSLSTPRVGLSTSSNPVLKLPYRPAQKLVSKVILDLMELTRLPSASA